MRALRKILALLVWLLATVVLIVSVVLCVTILLLPLGIPLFAVGMRLYAYGVQLMMPRAPEVKRGIRKRLGLRPRASVGDDVKRVGKRGKKAGGRVTKKSRKKVRSVAKAIPG
jgi:hypothetical protein